MKQKRISIYIDALTELEGYDDSSWIGHCVEHNIDYVSLAVFKQYIKDCIIIEAIKIDTERQAS